MLLCYRSHVVKFFVLNLILFLGLLSVCGQQAQGGVVTVYGREFYLDGQSFEFVGVNLRGLCHYGQGDILVYTSSGDIDSNLNAVAAMGGKVVRVFAPVKFATHSENVDRLEAVLDKMQSLGLYALVSLTDLYHTGFHPQGDDKYYIAQSSGWTLLDDTWFAGGYQENYLPYVQLAATRLKDHPAIFAWELGNELTDIKNPNNIKSFASTVAAAIKSADPNHLVSTGFLSIDHTQIGESAGVALYSDPNIDFISVHSYTGDDPWTNHAVYSRVEKPLIVGEYGWQDGSGVDRPARTQEQLDKWLNGYQARGFLQWGFQSSAWDVGDGDNIYGMDRYAHSDYDSLYSLYSNWAATLAARSHTPPERLTPLGENIAPTACVGWSADSFYDTNNTGDKVYDGVISGSSKWTSNGSAPPHWLALDLGSERQVTGFAIQMAGAGGERFDYAFSQFRIESGDSLSGSWSLLFDVDNSPQFSTIYRIFDEPQPVEFLRFYITDSGIDNYCRLPEVEIYEEQTSSLTLWQMY